jgi:aryl-alcohol dehydrogenase-like predicted oxidoreductase
MPTRTEGELMSALDAARECGATLIDLAPSYGAGDSERLVGSWLSSRGHREEITLVTKLPPPGTGGPKEAMPAKVEKCLRRMRTDYIDTVLLHGWGEPPAVRDTVLGELRHLALGGTIGAVGISAMDSGPEDLVPLVRSGALDCVSLSYNVFDRSRGEGLLAACAKNEVTVLGRAPFLHGALAGFFRRHRDLPSTDDRAEAFSRPVRASLHPRVEAFEAIARADDLSPADLALSFAAAESRIDTLVVGMRTPDHIRQNVDAITQARPLPSSTLAQVNTLDWPDRFGPRES